MKRQDSDQKERRQEGNSFLQFFIIHGFINSSYLHSVISKPKTHTRQLVFGIAFIIANLFFTHKSFAQGSQIFNASGNFTVPIGVTNITVQAWGGGGAGGGSTNAGTNTARGGAGGGGGAFASATISVTPGSVLGVVVALQIAGSSGVNGGNGGNSTITTFESQILAAGGSGGTANTTGNSPAGGAGGSIANSAGTNRIAGAAGGNGATATSPTVASSGAGGNGANSGGAGGASVTGSGVTQPGNPGTQPGGGGSGGRTSQTAGNQAGGAGAAGRVIITWTCPAATISYPRSSYCSSLTSALVTVTGSPGGTFSATPAGLSINSSTGEINPSTSTLGNYTVHYQLAAGGSGCTTNVDATFAVSITTGPSTTFTKNDVQCFNTSTGQIIATGSSGTSPYTFSIDNGIHYYSSTDNGNSFIYTDSNNNIITGGIFSYDVLNNKGTFNGLKADTYKIRVKDNLGCESKSVQ